MFREKSGAELAEQRRLRERLETQMATMREEKARVLAELTEAQIKNEQIIELKRSTEADQREKMDLG